MRDVSGQVRGWVVKFLYVRLGLRYIRVNQLSVFTNRRSSP